MSLRRVAVAAATFVVAIGVALAVPVSQLRTVSFLTWCCCPDQSHCHCPHEQPSRSREPCMAPCHQTSRPLVAPQAPSFAAPEVARAAPPARAAQAPIAELPSPHAAPAPARPDAPS